ncbi:MAG: hypothetical protein CFE26_25395, partial [Verrucomicrobiales bacterium VVV1]
AMAVGERGTRRFARGIFPKKSAHGAWYAYQPPTTMRNDLYLGALVALGAHAALALVNPAVKPARLPVKDDGFVEVIFPRPEEPPEPPTPPEVGDTAEAKEATVAAPRLPDVPRVAPIDSITMAPTVVPEGEKIDPGVVTIPNGGPRTSGRVGEIYDPSALERAPLARYQAQPQYPFEMRRNGITGEILVEFIVDVNGAVREARAVRSSQREFAAAAVQAVRKRTFQGSMLQVLPLPQTGQKSGAKSAVNVTWVSDGWERRTLSGWSGASWSGWK